jgi:F0F1-type ATP synthase membrane subunit b/b'
MWIVLAGLVLVVVAGAIGWREVRRSQRELPERAERPRGLDLIIEPQTPAEEEPTAINPLEGSHDMPETPRPRMVADANDESARPSYDALGDRIASVLAAAEDAAAQTTLAAAQEAAEIRAQADAYSDEVRRSAEAAGAETRAAAEAEAARILSAAEERAKRTDESAIEHRQNLTAEAQSLQDLIDERRDWLRQITGALRDAAGRLERITDHDDDATDPISHALTDRRGRTESEYVG